MARHRPVVESGKPRRYKTSVANQKFVNNFVGPRDRPSPAWSLHPRCRAGTRNRPALLRRHRSSGARRAGGGAFMGVSLLGGPRRPRPVAERVRNGYPAGGPAGPAGSGWPRGPEFVSEFLTQDANIEKQIRGHHAELTAVRVHPVTGGCWSAFAVASHTLVGAPPRGSLLNAAGAPGAGSPSTAGSPAPANGSPRRGRPPSAPTPPALRPRPTRHCHLSQPHERPDDVDAHVNRARAVQDARQHDGAVFREYPRRISASAAADF